MDKEDYKEYLMRAEYPNMVGRTLDGLHGMMFRKKTLIECEDALRFYLDNVDGTGKSAEQFISDSCYELIQIGFGGVLADAPETGGYSTLGSEENGLYPYINYYRAEDIINWRFETVGRKKRLSLVVLREKYEEQNVDIFSTKQKYRYRVLLLIDGVYHQQVWLENSEAPVSDVIPEKHGRPLTEIPFFLLPSQQPEKPMLLDLVDVNLALYRKSADYENGMHYCSIPCPYTMGFTPEGEVETFQDEKTGEVREVMKNPEPIKLTSNRFLHFPSECTGVGMLESSGSGLPTIRQAMSDDEERMAILGARIISQERKGVEAVDTARIHRANENSVLSAFAVNMSEMFTNILRFYLEWCTDSENVEIGVYINTDYDIAKMNGSDIATLVALWQQGGISRRVLFDNLKEGEVIDGETTLEDMLAEIEEESIATVIPNGTEQNE